MDKRSKTSKVNGKKGGRKKGKKNPETLEREAVLKEFRLRAMKSADVLFNAQLHIATGQTFLYKIEKTKLIGTKGGVSYKPERPKLVTDTWEIEHYLNGALIDGDIDNKSDPSATYYYLTSKEPDNKAIEALLDRSLGKTQQNVDVTSGDEKIQPLMVKIIGNEDNGDTSGVQETSK